MIDRIAGFLLATGLFLSPVYSEDKRADDTSRMQIATEPLQACLDRWDADTHMTKQAWLDTCKRVAAERRDYLKKQGMIPDHR
jgi:hypothetical protein